MRPTLKEKLLNEMTIYPDLIYGTYKIVGLKLFLNFINNTSWETLSEHALKLAGQQINLDYINNKQKYIAGYINGAYYSLPMICIDMPVSQNSEKQFYIVDIDGRIMDYDGEQLCYTNKETATEFYTWTEANRIIQISKRFRKSKFPYAQILDKFDIFYKIMPCTT